MLWCCPPDAAMPRRAIPIIACGAVKRFMVNMFVEGNRPPHRKAFVDLSNQDIQAIYERRAKHYDLYVKLYRLLGFRYNAYRKRTIEQLHLRRGDCVLDLGCGTGLNFPLVIQRIGGGGRLIGVDVSHEMLVCARKRADAAGWANVELVQSDMVTYEFPAVVNGVLSTGAFGYIAQCDRVIEKAMHAMTPGGRLAIWDLKKPDHWPRWLFNLFFVWLGGPFGVTPDYVTSHPWQSVQRYFVETSFEQMYWGAVYISAGTAPSPSNRCMGRSHDPVTPGLSKPADP